MSPSKFLPLEILDLIVNHLSVYERTTLKACCLVSKSWVLRARRRLFFRIAFSQRSPIESWIKAFPDPSTSPARYTRALILDGFKAIDTLGTPAYQRAHAFHHIVELRLINRNGEGVLCVPPPRALALIPFHKLFPTIKSLSLYRSFIPPSDLPNLIYSFPLLKDLQLSLCPTRDTAAVGERNTPSTSPELTGTLRLTGEIQSVLPVLLGLPNFFRFSKIVMECRLQDSELTRDLVFKCSNTLESLSVIYFSSTRVYRAPAPSPFDLSKATKLKDLRVQLPKYTPPNIRWITATLQTIDSPKLEQISITSPMAFDPPGKRALDSEEWRDLDLLLARLSVSHSIRPEIKFLQGDRLQLVSPSLLPELAATGVFNSVVP